MREVDFQRKTNETNINLKLNLDGSGKCNISTKIPFFDCLNSMGLFCP